MLGFRGFIIYIVGIKEDVIMYYHRINSALRLAGDDMLRNRQATVKAIIYGKYGEYATAYLDMFNLRREKNRIRDAGRVLNAEQILFIGTTPIDDKFLPCSIDESMGKEAITVFSESDKKVHIVTRPFQRVGPKDIIFGKKYFHLIKDENVCRIEETESDAEFYSDKKNDIISMEALMN
jgi:hypothetical protein